MTSASPIGRIVAGAPRYLLGVAAYSIAASIASSLLGVIFLVAAGRLLEPSAIGTGFAATSLVALAGNLSLLGFATALIRFRTQLGAAYRDAAISTLFISLPISVAISIGIWATLGRGTALAASPWWLAAVLVLPAVIAGWLDAASIAAGDPRAVLIRNVATGLVRIALLLTVVHTDIDIVWTTCLALAISCAIVAPRRAELRTTLRVRITLPPRPLFVYALKQSAVTLAFNAPTYLAGVVVLAVQGATQAGYFGLIWGIGFMLSTLGDAAGQGLLAHGSRDEARLDGLHRKSLAYVGIPLTVAAGLGALLAPLLRVAYGAALPDYALLNFALICVAAVPYVVVTTTVGRLRVTSQSSLAFGVAALSGLGTIALILPLKSIAGSASPGWAYLAANLGAAAVALVILRASRPVRPAGPEQAAESDVAPALEEGASR